MAAIPGRIMLCWIRLGPCGFGVLPFAMWLSQQEKLPGRKGGKGLLLVGHKKVPHGSGLTGDHGGDTVDGPRTEGLPEPRTPTSFPEIQYPGLGKRKKEGLCAFVGILKNFSILMKTLSHYS